MKIKQIVLMLSLALLSFASYAEAERGDRELILSGTGTSASGFDTTSAAVTAEFGTFTTDDTEFGIRQSVGYVDIGDFKNVDNTALFGATYLFGDYHFDYNAWQPFVGGSLGVQYGENVDEAFFVGPEAGIKYYLLDKAFIAGRVAYLFNVEDEVDDGAFSYVLGIGLNF